MVGLVDIIDLDVICLVGLCLGVDFLGGVNVGYWEFIVVKYNLNISLVNFGVDFMFKFMILDWDGKICMDCFFFYVMVSLVKIKDYYDIVFGNDIDGDCYGIVIFSVGLMNFNYFFFVVIWYLFS